MRPFQWMAIAITIACVVGGCEPAGVGDYPAEELFTEGAGERVVHRWQYDTLWIHGSVADTVLVNPSSLIVAEDGGVYVLDPGPRPRVHRFTADGELGWSWGRLGGGPSEIQNVRAMGTTSSGGLVLV